MKRFIPKILLAIALAIGTLTATLTPEPVQATIFLKQSTASQVVKIGPYVDSTDGNTEKTGLTIANTDIKLSKAGGTIASKNSGGCTHDANGWYTCTFDATDTATVGALQVYSHPATALPVTQEFQVVEEAVYDALFGASALGYVANAPVNVAQFGGTNGTFSAGIPAVNSTQIGGTSQTGRDIGASVLLSNGTGSGQISFTSGVVSSNVTQAGGSAITSSGGRQEVNVSHVAGTAVTATGGRMEVNTSHWGGTAVASAVVSANEVQISGSAPAADGLEARLIGTCGEYRELGISRGACTAQSATSTTVVLDVSASFADDTPIGMTLVACGSTQGYCQSRPVTDYVSSTKTAVVDAWTVTPSGTVVFYLFNTAPFSGGSGGSTLTAAQVWAYTDRQLTTFDEDNTAMDLNATPVGTVNGLANSVITPTSIATDAFTAAKFASDVTTELQTGLATAANLTTVNSTVSGTKVTTDKLDTALAISGAVYQFTTNALANAPSGGGGGVSDWTAIEREQIRYKLNIDGSQTAPGTGAVRLADANALSTVSGFIDTEVATLLTRIGTPTDLGGGASLAANASDIEGQTDDIGVNGAGLTAADDALMLRLGAPVGANLSADIAGVGTGMLASQRILTGTCSSGSTTTCVDAALTQAAASQLQDRLICFDDSWCAMLTTFNPGTDTATTTKVAPSTRSARAYTIFPATAL